MKYNLELSTSFTVINENKGSYCRVVKAREWMKVVFAVRGEILFTTHVKKSLRVHLFILQSVKRLWTQSSVLYVNCTGLRSLGCWKSKGE